jgi:RimJ/RimL family protein N-acetyltransferase
MTRTNRFGQPIGPELDDWIPPPVPPPVVLSNGIVTLEPVESHRHGSRLHLALADGPDSLWTYMSFGPFDNAEGLRALLEDMVVSPSWVPYTVVVDDDPQGILSYLRVDAPAGVIEIGSIVFAPALQRTKAATAALHLMIQNVFDLGYRRCEWKCDALNARSRSAAERLGFTYEGTFRQALHYKGRNRDTAWYSIIDREWPALDEALTRWLSPANFDAEGSQRRRLREMRESI